MDTDFGEAVYGSIPVAFQINMILNQRMNLTARRVKSLDCVLDHGRFRVGGLEVSRCALGLGFCFTFVFGFVSHTAILVDWLFQEGDEVVSEAGEAGLLGFGGGTTGPDFGFDEFVFEFVEFFFDVPTGFVEQGDEAGRNAGGQIGEIVINIIGGNAASGARISKSCNLGFFKEIVPRAREAIKEPALL